MESKIAVPELVGEIGVHGDDRGTLLFGTFDSTRIKRFYMVENYQREFIRAWHYHEHESKYITVIEGSAVICAVKPDPVDFLKKDFAAKKSEGIFRFVLDTIKPSILYIPAGYANGWMSLKRPTKLFVFSDKSFEESKNDDIRFDAFHWNPPWDVVWR